MDDQNQMQQSSDVEPTTTDAYYGEDAGADEDLDLSFLDEKEPSEADDSTAPAQPEIPADDQNNQTPQA